MTAENKLSTRVDSRTPGKAISTFIFVVKEVRLNHLMFPGPWKRINFLRT